jgi:hypothetical protein
VLAFSHRTSGEQKRCRVLFWRFRAGQSSKYRQPVQSADAPKAGHILLYLYRPCQSAFAECFLSFIMKFSLDNRTFVLYSLAMKEKRTIRSVQKPFFRDKRRLPSFAEMCCHSVDPEVPSMNILRSSGILPIRFSKESNK